VHVEDGPQAVRRVRVQVRPVSVLRRCLEVVVLADQALEVALDVQDLVGRQFEFHQRHAGFLEQLQETDLGREQEQERPSLAVRPACRTTDAVDVITRVVRGVELDHPIHLGDVETSRCNVGTDESSCFGVAKLKEPVRTRLLLELSMQIEHGEVNVIQQLRVVLDCIAAGKEDDYLLLLMLFQERKQQAEPNIRVADLSPSVTNYCAVELYLRRSLVLIPRRSSVLSYGQRLCKEDLVSS